MFYCIVVIVEILDGLSIFLETLDGYLARDESSRCFPFCLN
jgi:hypothetical protein